jgi:hypothetical protein
MTSMDATNTAGNEMKVMVLVHLAALCKKLVENPAIIEGDACKGPERLSRGD